MAFKIILQEIPSDKTVHVNVPFWLNNGVHHMWSNTISSSSIILSSYLNMIMDQFIYILFFNTLTNTLTLFLIPLRSVCVRYSLVRALVIVSHTTKVLKNTNFTTTSSVNNSAIFQHRTVPGVANERYCYILFIFRVIWGEGVKG